jgi:hypothetical protein
MLPGADALLVRPPVPIPAHMILEHTTNIIITVARRCNITSGNFKVDNPGSNSKNSFLSDKKKNLGFVSV